LRITTGNVVPGSGAVLGGQAGSRATVANAARIMGNSSMPVTAGMGASEAKEFEQFSRQVRALKDELDPAAASTAKFAMQQDLLNRGLERGVLSAAEHKTMSAALSKAEQEAANALERSGHVVTGQSMKIRELIVVMRELARGDMTRLPGSLSILAGQFGLLSAVSAGTLLAFGAVAAGTALLITAMAKGEAESNKFANAISLSGNAAAFTSQKFEDMSAKVADSSRSSIGSTKELLLGIVGNAHFTSDEMGKLVQDAQLLGRATGQSADDVLSNFEKMADGPTKYAENFFDQYSGVITPTLVDHVRQLEATGQSYEATKQLVDGITEGLARNQVEQTGYIIRAWRAVSSVRCQKPGTRLRVLVQPARQRNNSPM
jgi:hypothetical protein